MKVFSNKIEISVLTILYENLEMSKVAALEQKFWRQEFCEGNLSALFSDFFPKLQRNGYRQQNKIQYKESKKNFHYPKIQRSKRLQIS